ncbi:MAG TPA: ABC transporter ATP-binding protein [Bacillota bacterium]|jgi:ATP-binding cassette subfamily B multidrug efflux pump|nr:ABC transporter ATP-binding protein [Bacillota bacterium]NLU54931.1 ABC transporter ATP-binding protein [Bacillota bacterium]HOA90984.1 ABC transporter ATP-binding protein [Bacillota bacterium]HPT60819.1 ABC transporter ATP-binding protein [Bacillota bacterium]HPZ73048.1 ABC transporter ATP-binding protein [Bacillota bacterium]
MKEIAKYLKPYSKMLVLVVVFVFGRSLTDLYLPALMSRIVDVGIVQNDLGYILKVGSVMIAMTLLNGGFAVGLSYFSSKVAMGFGRNLRKAVFTKVENLSVSEFNDLGTSSLITRTTNDITQLQQLVLMGQRMMLVAPMMFLGSIIMAVSQDAVLSLVIVFAVPALALLVYFIGKKATPLFQSLQKKLDGLNLVLRESLTGIRVIRAFNKEEYEKKRFNAANLDLTETALKVHKTMAYLMPLMTLLLNFGTIAVIWFGAIRVDSGQMQVGQLMAFVQYIMHIMFSLMMVSMIFVMIPRAAASVERVSEVLTKEQKLTDPETPKKPASSPGSLEFRNVTFSYPGAENTALSNVSFTAEPGETVAIIGGTGSGKSTLLNLIMRFYDLEEGSGAILVGGVDIREMNQKDLRDLIGFVSQKPVLFSGTVRDNITYGNESASDEEVLKALEIAQAKDFVLGLPEGLEAVVAQGGTNFSGGQKQRLSIARALVRRPAIYIFDDSFSALDFKTDAQLRAALRRETQDATKLIVAQRVSTVLDADKIIVLDQGRVVGIGRHKELLKTSPVYREIVASQLSEEELA